MPATQRINIVSFNIPCPADYGGVIDVFYKLKSLHEAGIEIILHAFEYGRAHAGELEKYCREVHYYKRKTGWLSQLSTIPYIVKSRNNRELLQNLQDNSYPILFEGLHTCYYLGHPALKNRLKMVRPHNIEHNYYRSLAQSARNLRDRLFFSIESFRLKRYQPVLHHADFLIPLSGRETDYFKQEYGTEKTVFVPLFHPNETMNIREKIAEPYLLFHGSLDVPENSKAVIYLIDNVLKHDPSLKLMVAGHNPSPYLMKYADPYSNVILIPNPDDEQLHDLMRNASIHLLYVKQASGVKLKLLNALYNGRFCIANSAVTDGSLLDHLCIVMPEDKMRLQAVIHHYYTKDFGAEEMDQRAKTLAKLYDNRHNARKIIDLLTGKTGKRG
jgi:hypothetical protein